MAPLKSSARSVGHAVRSVPDSLLSTVDSVVDGLSRVFQNRTTEREDESVKVGAVLDAEVHPVFIYFTLYLSLPHYR